VDHPGAWRSPGAQCRSDTGRGSGNGRGLGITIGPWADGSRATSVTIVVGAAAAVHRPVLLSLANMGY
jgi:hypothetical protein